MYIPLKLFDIDTLQYKYGIKPQSGTLYIYYIYTELACTQSPFFQTLPSECTVSVRNQNKDIEFWLSAHIVRAYPYMELQILRMSK